MESLPFEVFSRMVALFLPNPMDCLNLALTCKDFKNKLLDGTNYRHTFKNVPFLFFAMRDMWDMLLFRKRFERTESYCVLYSPLAPNLIVERAMSSLVRTSPQSAVHLENIRNDRVELVMTKLKSKTTWLAEHFAFRFIVLNAIRFQASDLLKAFCLHQPNNPPIGSRSRYDPKKNEILWQAAITFDSLWAYNILHANHVDMNLCRWTMFNIGPVLAPLICPGSKKRSMCFWGLVHDVVSVHTIDTDFIGLYDACDDLNRHDLANKLIQARPKTVDELRKSSIDLREVQPEHVYLRAGLAKVRKQLYEIVTQHQFSDSTLKDLATHGPPFFVKVLGPLMVYTDWREIVLHAAKTSFQRLHAIWDPRFNMDFEIFQAGDTKRRRNKTQCLKFIRLFHPDLIAGAWRHMCRHNPFRNAYKTVLHELFR